MRLAIMSNGQEHSILLGDAETGQEVYIASRTDSDITRIGDTEVELSVICKNLSVEDKKPIYDFYEEIRMLDLDNITVETTFEVDSETPVLLYDSNILGYKCVANWLYDCNNFNPSPRSNFPDGIRLVFKLKAASEVE